MADWQKLYLNLPHPMRSLAASIRGISLRFWRYGPETEKLVAEALERDSWDSNKWKNWQEERLVYVLHRAATKVPYYRQLWTSRRLKGDRSSYEYLENWPILKKEALRSSPTAFVADDLNPKQMFCDRTSGTSGTPLQIYQTRKTITGWYALFEARTRRWHGTSIHDHWAMLGGQLIVPYHNKKPPFWVHNWALNQIYLSNYHLAADTLKYYVDALKRFQPTHMIAYPSSATVLAEGVLSQGIEYPPMQVFFSNAEYLSSVQRDLISHAFVCPVRNTYGMAEIAIGSSECQYDSLHIWPESGIIEVCEDERDQVVPSGQVGRFIISGIFNADMPLIRYEVGDRGHLTDPKENCVCGRQTPIIGDIEGRLNDLVYTPDGRKVFWLNPIFYGLPLREAQIVQENIHLIRVCIVPHSNFNQKQQDEIIERLRNRVGDMEISLELVDSIPRSSNGKFQGVVNKIHSQ